MGPANRNKTKYMCVDEEASELEVDEHVTVAALRKSTTW